jgi:hypothetical protein
MFDFKRSKGSRGRIQRHIYHAHSLECRLDQDGLLPAPALLPAHEGVWRGLKRRRSGCAMHLPSHVEMVGKH